MSDSTMTQVRHSDGAQEQPQPKPAQSLYDAAAQALADAAHNATYAQQQSYVTAQAASTMGVAQILSGTPARAGVSSQAVPAQSPEELQAKIDDAANLARSATQAVVPPDGLRAGTEYGADTGQSRVDARAFSTIIDPFAEALNRLSDSSYHTFLHIIQLGATAACLKAMIDSPETASSYEPILEAIRKLH